MSNERSEQQYILARFLTEFVASDVWKIMRDEDRREIINRVRFAIADGKKECLTPTLRGSLRHIPLEVLDMVFRYFHRREQRTLDNIRFGLEVNRRRDLRRQKRMAE
jgi:hypothetical protein